MKRIAKFEKVSFGQFSDSWNDIFQTEEKDESENRNEEVIKAIYDQIKLPKRATAGSAGYDFFAPVDIILNPGETIKIPTGIRVWMEPEWVLKCYPRSGLGFKFRLQLNNTVGIIDSDYYNSDNEGHIFAKLTNDSNEEKTVQIKAGEGFMQGIFVEYGITVDDSVTDVRNGGFGSTTE
ncbi:deoxyuridine 5'-triphosphate nucleotidohydrolase [[Ruminococcus] torques]|uniref:deoxyuridine 5'-triphosphate nucleotidohydrolase n=1 Tax=[Ruminococcus] torques TaxID=33039 RepID=UPI001D0861B1|nr:deoxyuridine 5'-triphosphate nucleotidohydrolase [[Ruminococcus] torques]MCB6638063.1 deoxyuridine 5'-triphosphate nucleotidohydrolase [[Ruminococcus] torques]